MTSTQPALRTIDAIPNRESPGFGECVRKLQTDLLPQLDAVVHVLRTGGFDAASVAEHYAGACLSATCVDAGLSARLRFEYENRTLSVPAGQPVFWIFTIHCGNRFVDGHSGRMAFPAVPGETNPVIEQFFAAVRTAMLRWDHASACGNG
jgi:hypothetical protein